MSEKTNISWATSTGNPWLGCTKVSPGCRFCYAAELDAQRFSKTMGGGTKEKPESHWGKGSPRVRTKAFWTDAVKWNRQIHRTCRACGHQWSAGDGYCPQCKKNECDWVRPRIFPSLCDWLDDEVPIEWLADFLKLIHDTPNLDWLLLSKRPENWEFKINDAAGHYLSDEGLPHFDRGMAQFLCKWVDDKQPPENVWPGASVEDQPRADERIPLLLQIPAKVRFLSVEPLLEKVELNLANVGRDWASNYPEKVKPSRPHISWVIVGGESGKDRRDCGVEAICDVARQCVDAGVPCFVKQDCSAKPGQQGRIPGDIWKLKQFPKL